VSRQVNLKECPLLVDAVESALSAAYAAGREEALCIAEEIVARLSYEPDTPARAEVRMWANAAIQRARLK
jgi:hypothetical protein